MVSGNINTSSIVNDGGGADNYGAWLRLGMEDEEEGGL
jgi:hypothetical protein